jgi:hypothetical protein
MKLGHDQFHHYTTRKITFESTPGLFLLDGVPLNRSTKHPASEDYFGDDASRLLPMLLAYKYEDDAMTCNQRFRPINTREGAGARKAIITNRLKLPERVRLLDMAKEKVEKQQLAEAHDHIYKDNNFLQIHLAESRNNPLVLTERLVFSSERQLRSTKHMHSCVVHTPLPANARLGLSPLRQYGRGQDKLHYTQDRKKFLFSR